MFDSRRLDIDNSAFREVDWSDFYPDADPLLPDNCPKSLGEAVKITCYVDANHTENMVTRRNHTGFVIILNSAPIIWWSKRQNTVESSTFGSEYVALRIATEQIIALRYKETIFRSVKCSFNSIKFYKWMIFMNFICSNN